MVHRHRAIILAALAAFASSSLAEVNYTVTASPKIDKITIEMRVPVKSDVTEVVIPNFAPGHYVLLSQVAKVTDTIAADEKGNAIQFTKPDDNTWRLPTPNKGSVKFTYSIPITSNSGAALMQGPYFYMYVKGRVNEKCRVRFVPSQGVEYAVSLDPTREKNVYTAPDYDVLADCPVTIGDFLQDTYTVRGIPHHIVRYGAGKTQVDMKQLVSVCKRITESQADFFGDLPYNRYVWHLGISGTGGGGGGLEHLNSTNITMGSRITMGTIGLLSHEFFHLWNVKRIRSKPLGPFDYQVIPKTGALWWLEGVTDYYASVLNTRAGLWTEDEFNGDLLSNLDAVRRRQQRFETSIYDSSYRVGETNNGRGNSAGFGQNYYNSGWIAGLCLDLELRSVTGGRHSLDDVMKGLYAICRPGKPGFEEGAIRDLLVKYGGPTLGEKYDQWIMKPGDLPVEGQLAKLALKIDDYEQKLPVLGFVPIVGDGPKGMAVSAITGSAVGQLRESDVALSINGKALGGDTAATRRASVTAATEALKPGEMVTVKVLRDGKEVDVTYAVGSRSVPARRIERLDFGRADIAAIRKGWIN